MDVQLNLWKRRALVAENRLLRAGLPGGEQVHNWSDDAYLVATLQKKDGTVVHVDELNAARERLMKAM